MTQLEISVVTDGMDQDVHNYGIDSIHGANYLLGATLFPQPLGMAATWNPDLMLRGSQVAAETKGGPPMGFFASSPMVMGVGSQVVPAVRI